LRAGPRCPRSPRDARGRLSRRPAPARAVLPEIGPGLVRGDPGGTRGGARRVGRQRPRGRRERRSPPGLCLAGRGPAGRRVRGPRRTPAAAPRRPSPERRRMTAPDAPRPLDLRAVPLEGLQVIEASAGTGKTRTITGLFLRLVMERDIPVEHVLVV